MDKKVNSEELQSRREFFKKAAKVTLPMMAAVALASAPAIVKASESTYCQYGCNYGCEGCNDSCYGSCKGGCNSSCISGNCTYTCNAICKGGCNTGCTVTCSGSCRGYSFY